MKVPNFGDAHCGEGAEQSMQVVFPGRFCRVASCTKINQIGVKMAGGQGAPWSWFQGRLPTFYGAMDVQLSGRTIYQMIRNDGLGYRGFLPAVG